MPFPKITETARLYADVELRFTPGGKAVANVPLVFSKRKKNAQGDWEDAGAVFVRGTAWDQLAENCAESLFKGVDVLVSGELSVREYERKDGSKGTSVEMNIYAIGPSLNRATVKVNKAERGSEQQSSSQGSAQNDPWNSAPPIDDPAPF